MVKEAPKNPVRKVYAPLVGCLQINFKGYCYAPAMDQAYHATRLAKGQTVEIVEAVNDGGTAPKRLYTKVVGNLRGDANEWIRTERQHRTFP